jgi:hypothetical protein
LYSDIFRLENWRDGRTDRFNLSDI